MLVPRFSIKVMLGMTTGLAVCFLVFRQAIQGQFWAIALATVFVGLAILFSLFATFFGVAYFFSILGRARSEGRVESPFAQDRLPPQLVPPRDVE